MVTASREEGLKYVVVDLGIARDPHSTTGVPEFMDSRAKAYSGRITPIGTSAFLAPEVELTKKEFTTGETPGSHFSYENDIWALGVTAYKVSTGKMPYKGEEPFLRAAGSVMAKPLKFPSFFPPSLTSLLQRMLVPC